MGRANMSTCRVVLASANVGRQRVATEVSRPMGWRWQQRFAEDGPEGLLRDKTRRPGQSAEPRRDGCTSGGALLRRTTYRVGLLTAVAPAVTFGRCFGRPNICPEQPGSTDCSQKIDIGPGATRWWRGCSV